ncbi:MAG: hypothetical protein ABIG37_00045 [Nanoarchaeota archaeon]|nr:hypothetical protein [Nanoarchaeota archaeon]
MRIKFCPKCKSYEIELMVGGEIGLYRCKKCGFSGSIFPEKEIKLNKRRIK